MSHSAENDALMAAFRAARDEVPATEARVLHNAENDVGSTCTLCGHRGPVEHPCPSVEKDAAPTWTRLTRIKAVVTFTCVCGGEHEADFSGAECDGTTSVEWKCDDCDRPLLVYVDVDARVRETTPIPPGGG